MTSVPPTAPRGSRRPYVIGAVLGLAAVVIGVLLASYIVRGLTGYEVTRFRADEPVTIQLGSRGEALWRTPADVPTTCSATDAATGEVTLSPGSADRMTITDGGSNWLRVGIVEGPPGSRHVVVCSADAPVEAFGHAPNPRITHYVVVGVTFGLLAAGLATAAFVLVLVTATRRSRERRQP